MASPLENIFTSSAKPSASPVASGPLSNVFGPPAKAPTPVAPPAPPKPIAQPTFETSAAPKTATSPLQSTLDTKLQANKLSPDEAKTLMDQAHGIAPVVAPSPDANSAGGKIALGLFPSTLKTLSELQLDPLSLKADPSKALGDRTKSMGDAIFQEGKNISDFFGSLDSSHSAADRVSAGVKVGLGGINALISPVTSLFAAANDIPVLGSASRLIGVAFNALGEGGTVVGKSFATPIVNKLPLSPTDKTKIIDAFGAIYSTAAQFSGGAFAGDLGGIKENLVSKFGETDANTIINKAQEVASGKDLVEKPTLTDIATAPEVDEKGKLPAPSDAEMNDTLKTINDKAQLPKNGPADVNTKIDKTVDLTPKGKDLDIKTPNTRSPMDAISDKFNKGKPVTDVLAPKTPVSVKGSASDFKVTEDTGEKTLKVVDTSTGKEQIIPRETVRKVVSPSEEIVKPAKEQPKVNMSVRENDGEAKTSAVAKSVEAKAIEKGLTTKYSDLAEFKGLNMKEQASRAVDILDNDRVQAKNIATGKLPAPEGVHPLSVFTAVENRAIEQGDGETLRDLANSPIARGVSEAAQTLRLAGERDPADAVKRIQEVQKAREDIAEKKTGKKADEVVKKDVQKGEESIKEAKTTRTKRVKWDDFVKQLQC